MPRFATAVLALALCLTSAAPPDLAGKWKLVVLPFGHDEFLIVDLKTTDGALSGNALSTQNMLGERKAEGKISGDAVTLDFPGKGMALSFRGKVGPDGKALGLINYGTTKYPARLEKTDADKVAPLSNASSRTKLADAMREADPKAKVTKLLALIHENAGQPYSANAYSTLLGVAEKGGLSEAEVRKHVETWTSDATPYGTEWVTDIRTRALRALQDQKPYAGLSTELARAAQAALPADAPLDVRASITGMLERSARLAGKIELADTTLAKLKELDAKLDEEYHKTVPPFKPQTFAGRKNSKADRAVVMEIFTGAECPPCVGADVGFDALLKSYKPTEFIGLQYHLHIPGPDPLTNDDTVARQTYYGAEVRGTPTTFFDGKRAGGSGGLMQHAEAKYNEYRGVIDPALETPKTAEITLTATRSGDELKIKAAANAKNGSQSAKPRLRLILVEESVRYPGSNKLRFHHNVVRGFPGGVAGKALEGGKGSVDLVVKLSDVRKAQGDYLGKFPGSSGRSFPHPLPPVDLDDLAVVALVQDDADHAIWQGVQVAVPVPNP
jgi:hypothetical protein